MKAKIKSLPYIFCIILGIILAIFFKLFVFDLVAIKGTSMEPTLKEGKKVFVNKICYGIVRPFSSEFLIQWKEPELDDLVIFLHDKKMTVKRCVALENTPLAYYENSGYYLKVNGYKIPLNENQFKYLAEYEKVPQGMVLLIGDNYEASIDSRDYGFISVKNVVGKVKCN